MNKKKKYLNIFFFSLFFDELFSIFLKRLSKHYFLIPNLYFFDKYLSYWTSYNFFKKKFYFFSFKFFFDKNNNSYYIYLLLIFFIIFYIFLVILNILF